MQKKLSLKYMKLGAAVSILLCAGVLAHALAHFFHLKYGLALSFIAIGSAFFASVNMFLWHLPIIRYCYELPDMRGEYLGFLNYSYRNDDSVEVTGTMKTIRQISQNGYSVFIRTTIFKGDGTTSSVSTAHEANVFVEDENIVRLEFTYFNEGDTDQGFPPHHGTEILRFDKKAGMLKGHYYTNRLPFQTKGTLELKKSPKTK